MDMINGPKEAPHILIVEDDKVSAMLLRKHFESMNLYVDHAEDGEAALAMHQRRSYRLVVSDWMMPKMDGISLCQAFRALSGPYVCFILYTTRNQREEKMAAFDAGVDDFLAKPLDRDELRSHLNVVRRILSSEEALQVQKHQLESSSERLESLNSSLEIASQRFQELFSGLPVGCFTLDSDGTIHEWNREAENVFGIQAFQAMLRPVWDVMENASSATWSPEQVDGVFSGVSEPNIEWNFTHANGNQKFLVSRIIRLKNAGNQTFGAICATTDITERHLAAKRIEEMNEQLTQLAVTDGLTGLSNRRRFQELLKAAVQEQARTGEPVSLIILDIDHFKSINDVFGHQAGDEILIKFAQLIRECARKHELPARYGGEEFALILGRCDSELAYQVAERFRSAIESATWPFRAITASLGVTTLSGAEVSGEVLIGQADLALYSSKQNGRNRVTAYRDIPADPQEKAA